MRVAALVPEAFGGRGGIALYNRDLMTALCEIGDCEGVVALPRLVRDEIPSKLPSKLSFRSDAARGMASFLRHWFRLLIEAPSYDLILCAHINLLPFAAALRRRSGAPLVLLIYGIDAWQKPHRRTNVRLVRAVDAVISISDITRKKFMAWAGITEEKIFLLPNALHPEKYGPGGKPAYLDQRYKTAGCRVILTLGRLSAAERYKGIDEILELMPDLLREDSTIRYLVVGDGDDRPRLEAKAKALGIGSSVLFAGWIDEPEKADHFRLADAFVMAGRGEGFGFVFLEAMACGTPVVASTRDGSREAVRDGRLGLLADPDDPAALREAIVNALNTRRSVPDGLEYFFYQRFCERLAHILDRVHHSALEPA